jgi:LysM repeat protein/tetratricopeptide (TPR) repeat protein
MGFAKYLAKMDVNKALETAREIDDPGMKYDALMEIAKCLVKMDVDMAKKVFNEALETAREIKNPLWKCDALREIAGYLAKIDVDKALEIARDIDNSENKCDALTEIAKYLTRMNIDKTEKVKLFDKLVEIVREIGNPLWKSDALVEIAKRLIELKQYERALEILSEARELTDNPILLKEINKLRVKCLKFTNGGLHVCDDKGYSTKQNYSVYLSYTKHTSALVAESGPWNVDDNYWANYNDPTPRRMFADLALGMPEAQAAYFNGYNGGADQFGRIVTAPYGIDLARKVSIDIGLKPGKNDWINISYLWTEGWNNKSSGNPTNGNSSNAEESSKEVISPIKLSTPNAEGIIIHTVQAGQSLWNIAAAYEVELAELMAINNLTKDSLIYPGEELIIKRINIPTQSTVETQKTVMVTETSTGIMKTKLSESTTITPSMIVQSTNSIPTFTSTPDNQENKNLITIFNSRNLLIGILFMTIIGIILLLVGLIYEQKNQ